MAARQFLTVQLLAWGGRHGPSESLRESAEAEEEVMRLPGSPPQSHTAVHGGAEPALARTATQMADGTRTQEDLSLLERFAGQTTLGEAGQEHAPSIKRTKNIHWAAREQEGD